MSNMQTMLLTIYFNSLLEKMREGRYDAVISSLEKAVETLGEAGEENGD